MKRHILQDVCGTTILAGAQAGRTAFAKWVQDSGRSSEPTVVHLDFSGIEAATSSFLRESIFAYRNHCRTATPYLYPVVANLSEAVEEEIAFFAEEMGDAFWACTLDEAGKPSNARLIGRSKLDEGQQEALGYVEDLGETSAPNIARSAPAGVGATAWNNRLAALSERGLVIEERRGKTKTFRPVLRA